MSRKVFCTKGSNTTGALNSMPTQSQLLSDLLRSLMSNALGVISIKMENGTPGIRLSVRRDYGINPRRAENQTANILLPNITPCGQKSLDL